MNSFTEKIEDLVAGKIPELVVEREDFFDFRDVWKDHPQRKKIIGEAGLNGRVVYRFMTSD